MRISNRSLLQNAAQRLAPILDELVFVGGCAAGLLLTDPAAPEIRSTYDVDVVAEIGSYAAYAALTDRLSQLGFAPVNEPGTPICRWRAQELLLDLMPSQPNVLGFANPWFPSALRHARPFALSPEMTIRLIDGPHFLATKLSAFDDRGKCDYWMSQDLEDVVAVIDGRPELLDELPAAPEDVRRFTQTRMAQLDAEPFFQQALPGFLPSGQEGEMRLPILRQRWRTLAGLAARTA